jgi:hypothetical protein
MRALDTDLASPRAIFVAALAVVVMAGGWILFVAGTRLHEMIVGAASVLLSGIFLLAVHKRSPLPLCFRIADLATGWRIPGEILSDVVTITAVLFRDLLGIEKAGSFYRVSGFKTSKEDPVLAARRVLATVYTTTAPNSIVIGIDYTQSRMLFHQLKRSPVSRMTKSLGAQS